jgi:hypothetical protein
MYHFLAVRDISLVIHICTGGCGQLEDTEVVEHVLPSYLVLLYLPEDNPGNDDGSANNYFFVPHVLIY